MTPPGRRTFRRTFREKFLGRFKKNIVQRNVAEKKILASNWGLKKNSCTEKLPNPPPPQISNGPSLNGTRKQVVFNGVSCFNTNCSRFKILIVDVNCYKQMRTRTEIVFNLAIQVVRFYRKHVVLT